MESVLEFVSSPFRIVIIVLLTVFIVTFLLRHFGVFEISANTQRAVGSIKDDRKDRKRRRLVGGVLGFGSAVTLTFKGIFFTEYVKDKHEYYIQRLELRTKTLGRLLTPLELRGMFVTPFLLSLLFIPLAFFIPGVLTIPVIGLIIFVAYPIVLQQKIADEDVTIDNYFIDLYLLLYSKLKQGSRARLQGTLENYIDTLEKQPQNNVTSVMLKFAKYFLNLLALYEDHIAVPKLREIYKSATIINFCNVAAQALQGIDNADNLLTFKMQLTERKTNLMRKRQEKILRQGNRSVFAIWIILFIFIIVGWYSKIPTGGFKIGL